MLIPQLMEVILWHWLLLGFVMLVGVWYFSCDGDLIVLVLVMNDGGVNGKVAFFTPLMCGIIRRQPAQRGA